MNNCVHPYKDTFRVKADALIGNRPLDRKVVVICNNCQSAIDIEENENTEFTVLEHKSGCNHPENNLEMRKITVNVTRNKEIILGEKVVEFCNECNFPTSEIKIPLDKENVLD